MPIEPIRKVNIKMNNGLLYCGVTFTMNYDANDLINIVESQLNLLILQAGERLW